MNGTTEHYKLKCLITKAEEFYIAYTLDKKTWIRFEDEIQTSIPNESALLQMIAKNEEIPLVFVLNRVLHHIEIAEYKGLLETVEKAILDYVMRNKAPLTAEEWTCAKCHYINSWPHYNCKGKLL